MKETKEFQELVFGERKSLHDISNQLVVAQGMASFVLKAIKKKGDEGAEFTKEIERLEKVLASVGKITSIVQERREFLHSMSEDKK